MNRRMSRMGTGSLWTVFGREGCPKSGRPSIYGRKALPPSPDLRKAWHHDPATFEQFAASYRAELDQNSQAVDDLCARIHEAEQEGGWPGHLGLWGEGPADQPRPSLEGLSAGEIGVGRRGCSQPEKLKGGRKLELLRPVRVCGKPAGRQLGRSSVDRACMRAAVWGSVLEFCRMTVPFPAARSADFPW